MSQIVLVVPTESQIVLVVPTESQIVLVVPTVSSVTAGDYHVMVSYQWSSRVYVARLCDRLQAAGCKVWLDLEHKGMYLHL